MDTQPRGPLESEEPPGAAAALLGETPAVERERRTVLATAALGVLLVVLAAVVLVDAASLPEVEAEVGPAVVPTLVGVLLAVVGVALVLQAVRHLPAALPGPDLPARWLPHLALMVGLLLAYALLLPLLGFVVTSAALFTGAALLLGARSPWRTLAYGWTLAALTFLVFDVAIGLNLPTGPWGF